MNDNIFYSCILLNFITMVRTIGAKSPYAFRANNALPFKYAYEPITVENH